MSYYDPTKVALVIDPLTETFKGVAYHGDTPFDVPFISEIAGDTLFMGGCIEGLPLPKKIVNILSLYPWEQYRPHGDVRSFHEVRMYDSSDGVDREQVLSIARLGLDMLETGPTLVHCQAGLNRSGLIVATMLVLAGDHTPAEAIALLREKRSPAVLCNQTFEQFVLGLA